MSVSMTYHSLITNLIKRNDLEVYEALGEHIMIK